MFHQERRRLSVYDVYNCKRVGFHKLRYMKGQDIAHLGIEKGLTCIKQTHFATAL